MRASTSATRTNTPTLTPRSPHAQVRRAGILIFGLSVTLISQFVKYRIGSDISALREELTRAWVDATAREIAAGRVVILDAGDEIDPEQIERDERH